MVKKQNSILLACVWFTYLPLDLVTVDLGEDEAGVEAKVDVSLLHCLNRGRATPHHTLTQLLQSSSLIRRMSFNYP